MLYRAIGNSANRINVTAESVQLTLLFRKQYNINVQAMHQKDHNIKGAWSDALKIDTKNLGKFLLSRSYLWSFED